MSTDGAEGLSLQQQIGVERAVAAMLVQEVYRFLVEQKLVSDDAVHSHLHIAASTRGKTPSAQAFREVTGRLSELYKPQGSRPARPALQVIEGGLSGEPDPAQ